MQMKLGKLLAETKTGEKRQIEPEKDGRGQKYEFELAGYHFFVRDMVKKQKKVMKRIRNILSQEELWERERKLLERRKELHYQCTLSLERKRIFFEWEYRQRYMVHM